MRYEVRGRFGLVLAAASLGAVGGCSKPGYDQYVPTEQTARQAVEAALNRWREGGRPGKVPLGSASVEVVDSRWDGGQKLASYEIVKEEPGDNVRWFTVRLTMQKPAGVVSVRYAVVGKDPLWVYREEDYKKMTGM